MACQRIQIIQWINMQWYYKSVKLDSKHITSIRMETVDEPNDEVGLNDKNINSILELVKRKIPNKYDDVKDTFKRKVA